MIDDLAMHIARELADFFQHMDERGILPKNPALECQLPGDAIARVLKQSALNEGATTAFADVLFLRDANNMKSYEILGHRYEVNFTVPGVDTVLRVSFDSWF